MRPPAQLLLLLLLLQSPENTVSQTSSTPLMVASVLGESVTLPLKFPAGEEIDSITWLHNGTSIIYIEPNEARITVTAPKWKERLKVTQSYSLQLNNPTMADAGSYDAMVVTMSSSVFYSYTLRIFRQLRRPHITVDSVISENGTCHATLRCSVEEGGENVIYRWTSMGPGAIVSQEGSILNDSWSLDGLDQNYACTAVNPVSNSTSSLIFVKQLCAGSKAVVGTYCPVTWILLGKGLLLLMFLAVLGTWHIQTHVFSKPLMSNSGL
ncbi:SLAM family member 6-like [Diceros bicornis minor]|uniref:SLAM family member 6-like n=1 Tax=Diceros bicornis minor TaxID=77932 RepID=UPI0026EF627A|nr:SLAM family member 6-like [Diceros bicornis minor]